MRTWAAFDAQCARSAGSLLDHDTTADVARDMNLLREAVGDPVLNYVGSSYGTGLGATYANLFPGTTGHMIARRRTSTRSPGPRPTAGCRPSSRQAADQASAAVMRDFLDLCGEASTSACAFSAGTPAATRAKWATLLRRLRRHPVTIGTPPQTYTYADGWSPVPLGTVSQWQTGAQVLQQLWVASGTAWGAGQPDARQPPRPPPPRATPPAVYTGAEQDARRVVRGQPRTRATRPPTRPPRTGASPAVGRLRPGAGVEDRGVRGLAGRGGPGPVLQARGTGPPPAPSWSSATPATRSCPTRTRSRCPGTWPARGC